MRGSRHANLLVACALVVLTSAAFAFSAHAVSAPSWLLPRGGPRLVVVRRVHTGSQPKSVTVSPDGRQVWVAAFGLRNASNVDVFDGETLALWGRVSFHGNAVETVFTRDGRTAYVSSFSSDEVHEIDVGTRVVRATIPVGWNPKVLALSHDGSRLYVVNWRSNDVYVIDVRTRAVLQRLSTERHPRGIAVFADGRVLVASTEGDVIHEFDRDGRAVRRIDVCEFPRHLVLSRDERTLYVTCSGASLVTAYDVTTFARLFSARTGANPRSLAASSDGRFLASADFDGTSVTLMDLTGHVARRAPIDDASQIVGVAVAPSGRLRVYATSWGTRELIALEPAP